MANRKVAEAAQSKSTFIAEYQNGLSFYSLCPKGYSQGPKDGKQGQETLNQLQGKHVHSAKQRENDQDPSKSKHEGDDIIDGENQKKGPISGKEEEKVKDGNGQKPSGANKKEALVKPHRTIDTDAIRKNEEEMMKTKSKNPAKKDKTVKHQEEKLTEEMKEQPGEEQKQEHEGDLKKEHEEELNKEDEEALKKKGQEEEQKKEEEDELKKEQEELKKETEKMKKELQEQMKKDKLRNALLEELKKEEELKMKKSWREALAKFFGNQVVQVASVLGVRI